MSELKKLPSLEELAKFCIEHNLGTFDVSNTGYTLSVQVPGVLAFAEKQSNTILYCRVKVCHTLLNRNSSYISEENMKRAMPTLKNQPLLAAFKETEDGELDFDAHNIRVVEDEDGTHFEYEERQIGSFDATVEPYLEYDEEHDKTYVIGLAAVPREYSPAADIIERKGGTKVSCELMINKMSVNSKEKYIELEDFEFTGVTLLGESVLEGMEGSRADIVDFSTNVVYESDPAFLTQLEEPVETQINEALSINNDSKEGGTEVDNDEIITEVVEETPEETVAAATEEVVEETPETVAEETPEVEVVVEAEPSAEFTVKIGEQTKTFSVSLKDKLNALNQLVNETYGEADNDWYDVDADEDNKVVSMFGWCTGRSYRQSYKVKGDNYSLTGDRVETYARYLTEDEIKALESMKVKYAELEQFKADREAEIAHEQRMAVLSVNDYSAVEKTDEYKELVENIDQYSTDEIVEKADAIVGKYARQGMKFSSAVDKPVVKAVGISISEPKNPKSYSGLFND